ncbi:YdeI/OmpD-associated family protein [Herbiconiux sp. VKM Ac-2851]|uniref:YdeI/OmpD-associated family protein n=1 Tax=Herbiconiux sp. VKM Ac-2851 TaxID=2739025 RepID=UPI001563CB7C|nr:YdeI/OmpD-associated family protein [Herbiconiux sp. VKM Ac-2851]
MPADYPHRQFDDAAAFDAFLAEHGASEPGVRLRIAKKGSEHTTITHSDAIDVALCHGWIDGIRNALDADFFLQTFTPRRPRSLWSKVNRLRVEALIEAGRMRPAGLAEIDLAKSDGRWEAAYDSQRTIEVQPDLAAALEANPEAKAFFATLSSQNRYAILFRLHNLKRAETRARRIDEFVAMLARHETVYPQ